MRVFSQIVYPKPQDKSEFYFLFLVFAFPPAFGAALDFAFDATFDAVLLPVWLCLVLYH